ncbi:MAG: transcriptional regulator TetR family [Clostridiales bacterium]|nr:transcriptional regulator TetR family [Clostridiales bacterium]
MESTGVQRKESIVFTTIDVINEFGIQSVSTREVAKREGISEATIYKYFPRKSDLLLAVLDCFSQFDNDIFQTTRQKNMNPKEAISFYIDCYLVYYENYPAITAVYQAFCLLQREPVLENKVKSIYFNRFEFMKRMTKDAQEAGTLSNEVDSSSLAEIIISTCRGIGLRWRLNNFGFSLREEVSQAVKIILDGFN